MMNTSRDPGIQHIVARKDRHASGMGLGVILLDDSYPAFPGDVRNPSAYPFPIQYDVVSGVDIKKLVVDDHKIMCLPPIIKAAQRLEKMGCRAIVGECGYFAYFQREVAASVSIPVFMSSLLQVPLAQQVVGSNQVVGILMANSKYLSDHHLESVGVRIGSNYVIAGAMDDQRCREFDHLWTTGSCAPIPRLPTTKKLKPSFWAWHPSLLTNIRRWVRWCWSVPVFHLLRVLCSGLFPSRSSVGEPCWILPTQWLCTVNITVMFNSLMLRTVPKVLRALSRKVWMENKLELRDFRDVLRKVSNSFKYWSSLS